MGVVDLQDVVVVAVVQHVVAQRDAADVLVAARLADQVLNLDDECASTWSTVSDVKTFQGDSPAIEAGHNSTIVAQAYIIDQTPEKHRSTALGFYFFGSMEGTGVLTPLLGYSIDRLGFNTSFTISSAAVLALLVVCSFILWLSRK